MTVKRTPRYGETRPTAALAIKHVRRLVRVGHCGEAASFLRDNPQLKVRRGTLLRLQKAVWACKPWIPPSLRR
jgi:hypothetical protein